MPARQTSTKPVKVAKRSAPVRASLNPQPQNASFSAIGVSLIDDESIPWIPLTPYSDQIKVKYFVSIRHGAR